jgi:carboxypeptidase T
LQRRIGLLATAGLVAALCTAGVGAPARPTVAATTDFPAGWAPYHTYAEMVAELDAAVANYPDLVSKFSMGQSYEGRELWGVKISDNVGTDEDEPEVFFHGLTHAREHLTVEMNLYLVRLLTEDYATDARIKKIVNGREIWIVPMINPDGGEYDISGGTFHFWRKNRQPTPGTTKIGTDINRNFGFKWGCCGGSSGKPGNDMYRGPEPWSTPEARAYRDFINSRVVGGRQQIRSLISWHTTGKLIQTPYGYTDNPLPKTMSADDQKALLAMGKKMAALNGYTLNGPLYTVDGGQDDWAHYAHRIFAYTFEMYPAGGDLMRFYPDPSLIERETTRNREAVLYLLEQADCPWRSAGLGATRCGPLNDDFETGRGWKVNAGGNDTATRGAWERAKPARTATAAGVKQLSATTSGQADLVTGRLAGSTAKSNALLGRSSVRSPVITLGADQPWTMSLRYYLAHNSHASSADYLRVKVVGSTTSTLLEVKGKAAERNAVWASAKLDLSDFAGQSVRIRIEAAGLSGGLVEAGVDDVRIYSASP